MHLDPTKHLIALPKHHRDQLQVLADLGGGHLLRLLVRSYRAERTATRVSAEAKRTIVDGGDVRIWMKRAYDSLLEGPRLRARARLRAEDAVAASATDDRDD
jgi:hypothetical protein